MKPSIEHTTKSQLSSNRPVEILQAPQDTNNKDGSSKHPDTPDFTVYLISQTVVESTAGSIYRNKKSYDKKVWKPPKRRKTDTKTKKDTNKSFLYLLSARMYTQYFDDRKGI